MSNPSEKSKSKLATRISAKLDRKLASYVAAASSAGVALLAVQPAQAGIVFTKTNVTVNDGTPLDLNNDGVVDFAFGFFEIDHDIVLAATPQVSGNEVQVGHLNEAAAGHFGTPVGPFSKFRATSIDYSSFGPMMAGEGQYGSAYYCLGNWINATNRYLGLKFLINGEVHYGWARLSVGRYAFAGPCPAASSGVTLTGYAYETTPNKRILDGHTSGASKIAALDPAELPKASVQPATLGALALGVNALPIWRRENEERL